MTDYKCINCGRGWDDGPTRDYVEFCYCLKCVPTFTYSMPKSTPSSTQPVEKIVEAKEDATEKARADYYERLCFLQRKTIEDLHGYIHKTSGPCSLDDASPREWSLGSRSYYLQKDNDALRELCEEYREVINKHKKALEEARLKIN